MLSISVKETFIWNKSFSLWLTNWRAPRSAFFGYFWKVWSVGFNSGNPCQTSICASVRGFFHAVPSPRRQRSSMAELPWQHLHSSSWYSSFLFPIQKLTKIQHLSNISALESLILCHEIYRRTRPCLSNSKTLSQDLLRFEYTRNVGGNTAGASIWVVSRVYRGLLDRLKTAQNQKKFKRNFWNAVNFRIWLFLDKMSSCVLWPAGWDIQGRTRTCLFLSQKWSEDQYFRWFCDPSNLRVFWEAERRFVVSGCFFCPVDRRRLSRLSWHHWDQFLTGNRERRSQKFLNKSFTEILVLRWLISKQAFPISAKFRKPLAFSKISCLFTLPSCTLYILLLRSRICIITRIKSLLKIKTRNLLWSVVPIGRSIQISAKFVSSKTSNSETNSFPSRF